MNYKRLCDLEYEVGEIRKQYINMVKYDNLSLKEILDLGIDVVYVNGIFMYNSLNNGYIANDYIITDEEILNSKVKFCDYDVFEDGLYSYLRVNVELADDIYNKLNEFIEKEKKEDKENENY